MTNVGELRHESSDPTWNPLKNNTQKLSTRSIIHQPLLLLLSSAFTTFSLSSLWGGLIEQTKKKKFTNSVKQT